MADPHLQDPDDQEFMRRALDLAERGWGRVSPNPLVGAVVVQGGRIVGEGWHREYGAPHAEVEALRSAGELARGARLYVTLEPCSHSGKTGPCTSAIREAGIATVVFAARDPNPLAGGGGAVLRSAGLEVRSGVEEAAARALNAPFFHAYLPDQPRIPWTELKLALSLDGRVADSMGRSAWITGEEARAEVHRLRAGADAVAIGVGTAMADDPLLTTRGPFTPRNPPVRVVFDRKLSTPAEGRLARTAIEIPLWVICAPDAPIDNRRRLEAMGAMIIEAPDLRGSFLALGNQGIRSLLCEGGAHFASALLREDLVDRLSFFFSPLFLGGQGADPFRELTSPPLADAYRWNHLSTRVFGADTLITLER